MVATVVAHTHVSLKVSRRGDDINSPVTEYYPT